MTPKLPWGYRAYWRVFPVSAPPYQEKPRGFTRYVLRNKLVWAPISVTIRNYNKRVNAG